MFITTKSGQTWEIFKHETISQHIDTPLKDDGTEDVNETIRGTPFRTRPAFFIAKCEGIEHTADSLESLKQQLANL